MMILLILLVILLTIMVHVLTCHCLHAEINTNMHIERMHRTLKHIYLEGKKVKQLNKSIHALLKFLRDKSIDRLIVFYKGKLISKIKELRKRHKNI